jgi:hypothetical protein
MASPQPVLRQPSDTHIHVLGETCPVCEQPIPNDKAEAIRARLQARERALSDAAKAAAAQQIAAERAQIEAAAAAAVEKTRQDSAAAIKKVIDESAIKEAAARAAGKAEADTALQEKLKATELAAQGRDAEWREKIAVAEREKQGALTQLTTLQATRDKAINERVQEAREALEKDKTDALNAEKAKHADETQKLTGKLEALARQLEKKTAEELGEGAEVKLFDALRAEFDGDKIERVGKGVSGADIIHTVIHNGRACGKIIYDSKNSTAWRDEYVSKLVQDQTAAKADYAVLSTFKFPAGAKQVEVRETVIIVNPARAIAIAHIIRRQLVQVHALRLSKSERATKMAALFDYITSSRCVHLLERIESHADAILKLQEKEMKAHEAHWKQEGALLKSIQKVKAELANEIDSIIGTGEPDHDHDQT